MTAALSNLWLGSSEVQAPHLWLGMTALCCCCLAQRVKHRYHSSKDFLAQVHLGALAIWCLGQCVRQDKAWAGTGVVPSYLFGHQLAAWQELSHSKTAVFVPFPFSAPRTGLGGDLD